jgi:hypothetical protein
LYLCEILCFCKVTPFLDFAQFILSILWLSIRLNRFFQN